MAVQTYKFVASQDIDPATSPVFPTAVAAIPLNYDEAGAIEEFEVTLEYQFFDANTTT